MTQQLTDLDEGPDDFIIAMMNLVTATREMHAIQHPNDVSDDEAARLITNMLWAEEKYHAAFALAVRGIADILLAENS